MTKPKYQYVKKIYEGQFFHKFMYKLRTKEGKIILTSQSEYRKLLKEKRIT